MPRVLLSVCTALAMATAASSVAAAIDARASVERLGRATATPPLGPGASGPAVVRAQILLDRAWFSPGEIDGRFSTNMRRAVVAYQKSHELSATGRVDAATWAALGADAAPLFTTHTLTAADAAGPYRKVPREAAERAKLDALGYESLKEAIAERFHMSEKLLGELNRGSGFAAGERVLAAFPISIGGPLDPLPLGRMKIANEVKNPTSRRRAEARSMRSTTEPWSSCSAAFPAASRSISSIPAAP